MRFVNRFYIIVSLFFFLNILPLAAQHVQHKDILVIPENKPLPPAAKKLGAMKLGNNSTKMHCDYEYLLAEAKVKAEKMGGNVVKITRLIDPAFISSCYRIKADIYYTDSLLSYKALYVPVKKDTMQHDISDSSTYAFLYVYRLPDTALFAPSYDLYMGKDSMICKVKNKTREALKLNIQGKTTFWAEAGIKQSVTIDIRKGEKYYLRCGTKMGDIRPVPVLDIMNTREGMKEYNKLAGMKRDMDESYLKEFH